jgi:hypothetical protein
MMKHLGEVPVRAISLKLPEEMLETCGRCARALNLSRAQYIRFAIRRVNQQTIATLRSSRLVEAAKKVTNGTAAGRGREE